MVPHWERSFFTENGKSTKASRDEIPDTRNQCSRSSWLSNVRKTLSDSSGGER